MTDYTELITRLRSTKSRSKRKLLDEAAATIEAMARDLKEYAGCDACAHSNSECSCYWESGESGMIMPCTAGQVFEWRGVQE